MKVIVTGEENRTKLDTYQVPYTPKENGFEVEFEQKEPWGGMGGVRYTLNQGQYFIAYYDNNGIGVSLNRTSDGQFKLGDIVWEGTSTVPNEITKIDMSVSYMPYEAIEIQSPMGRYGGYKAEELRHADMQVIAKEYAYLLHYMQR